jgi:proton-dependent oligopeptide transporter, POT family
VGIMMFGQRSIPHDGSFFGHPSGLRTLFFTEFWERFSYYGMRALLILFMTAPVAAGGLGWGTAQAGMIYGTYTSLVYLVALPGGWVADRFIGPRKATLYGGIAIMCGHISLAMIGITTFYLGLALIIAGTGLLKPNISSMVGRLYVGEDRRRDAGFSIYYLGINLGAFAAPLVTGWLAQGEGFKRILAAWGITPETSWHWGFAAAAVGMALGLVQYLAGGRRLGELGYQPAHARGAVAPAVIRKRLLKGLGVIVAGGAGIALLAFNGMLSAAAVTSGVGYMLLIVTLGFFVWLFAARTWTLAERRQLIAIMVLFVGAAVFWSLFEQAGSTLNLFAQRSTRNVILGVSFPASWWQSLNSLYIMLLVPVMAWLWVKLGSRDPSSPAKFSFGLLFAALGFGVLAVAAQFAAAGVRVSPVWLALVYLLHTIGELCLSPVGLSAMTKLAPARIAGLVMGAWFLATSVGNYLGGAVASLYEAFALPTLFTTITLVALLATLLMALSIKPLGRMLARS